MQVRFKWGRFTGTIRLRDSGEVEVDVPDETLKNRLMSRLALGHEIRIPFRQDGIPGTMVNYEGLTESNFRAAMAALADETGIWVWDDGVSIVECPWFGTEGFTILYFRGDENNPWLIVEDIATGGQTLCFATLAKYVWFDAEITDTPLIKGWIDA